MELSELRKKIDSLDAKVRELLLDRMALAKEVAKCKMDSGNFTIYRKDREDEILTNLTDGLDADTALEVREIYRHVMMASRTIQYSILANKKDDLLGDIHLNSWERDAKTLVCQGIEGAYSHLAARKFSDAEIEFVNTFKDVVSRISGQNYGILPLDNSTEGMINEVYDLLLDKNLYIVKSIDLTIHHVLMANKGASLDSIKYITAHPQALRQCSDYISLHNLTTINATNNAVAARDLVASSRTDMCCLGDASNAKRYGLEIIDDKVNNSDINTTRFIVVADRLIAPENGGKVSLVFSVDNKSGTLANVLTIIASYGISLSKIESRPIADEKWEYRFYIDMDGNIREKKIRALIYELMSELPYVKVLGSYDEMR